MIPDWLNADNVVRGTITLAFAFLVPLAILAGRFAVKRERQGYLLNLLHTLEEATGANVALIPPFEHALHKYDLAPRKSDPARRTAKHSFLSDFLYFSSTALIFALIAWAGFALSLLLATAGHDESGVWTGSDLVLLSGFTARVNPAYARLSCGVVIFAFLGSYIWSINYLIGRIGNFDLSPVSFLRVTAKIVMACVVALVIRHISGIDGTGEGALGPAPEALILTIAFLTGMFPDAGINYLIDKVPTLYVKRFEKEAADTLRQLPVEIIDGITSQVAFRLAEREILDIQNLATENPILLCAETPYTPLECLDWIAQAQLVLEVGPCPYKKLRDLGVRTMLALEEAAGSGELEQLVLATLYPNAAPRPASLGPLLKSLQANVHVQRLRQINRVLGKLYRADLQPAASPDEARRPGIVGVVTQPAA